MKFLNHTDMGRRFYLTIFILFSTALPVASQTIFPGLSGQQLLDSLVARYKPAYTLGYTPARETMFTVIDNHGDSVRAVYSGFKIFLDPNSSDPIQDAYVQGVDTEHTWPKTKGAVGQAKSDLHHLYPTRRQVNSSRGSLDFDEIADSQADKWFRLDTFITHIPAQFIDEWSEVKFTDAFEPREDHKGNVARAMFYFYTMYKDKADSSSDPGFFSRQKSVLRRWNMLDPVDSAEVQRNNQIAVYQDGKENPFIVDTTLIGRAYFGVTAISDSPTGTQLPGRFVFRSTYPNPFNNRTIFSFVVPRSGRVLLQVYDLRGKKVLHKELGILSGGSYRIAVESNGWAGGFYLARLTFEGQQRIRKILLLK